MRIFMSHVVVNVFRNDVFRNDVFDDACTCFVLNKHLPVLIQGTNFNSAGYVLHVCLYEYDLNVLIVLLVMHKEVYSRSLILVFLSAISLSFVIFLVAHARTLI